MEHIRYGMQLNLKRVENNRNGIDLIRCNCNRRDLKWRADKLTIGQTKTVDYGYEDSRDNLIRYGNQISGKQQDKIRNAAKVKIIDVTRNGEDYRVDESSLEKKSE